MSAEKTQVRLNEERDQGLLLAIESAGSIGRLARGLGISQPAVSGWTRVPAERVVAVEALTGVSSQELRPDLYPVTALEQTVDPLNEVRSRCYLLLAHLLLQAPTSKMLSELSRLQGDASPLGLGLIGLAQAANRVNAERVEREFFDLFVGVGRGEMVPFGSYYQTGFLNERPLARVREDLKRLGIERRSDVFEPEDHLGFLFEVMAGLINQQFPGGVSAADRFFKRHIERWALRFFDDLKISKSAEFYRAVGEFGRVFLDIECEALSLPAEPDGLSVAV